MLSEAQSYFESLPEQNPSRQHGLALLQLLRATFRDCPACSFRPTITTGTGIRHYRPRPKPETDLCPTCHTNQKSITARQCRHCHARAMGRAHRRTVIQLQPTA